MRLPSVCLTHVPGVRTPVSCVAGEASAILNWPVGAEKRGQTRNNVTAGSQHLDAVTFAARTQNETTGRQRRTTKPAKSAELLLSSSGGRSQVWGVTPALTTPSTYNKRMNVSHTLNPQDALFPPFFPFLLLLYSLLQHFQLQHHVRFQL